MATKTEHWSLRVTPEQNTPVRQVLRPRGGSLNEYVMRHSGEAARLDAAVEENLRTLGFG